MKNLMYMFVEEALGKEAVRFICLTPKTEDLDKVGDVDWLVKSPRKALEAIKKNIIVSNYKIINIVYHSSGIRLNLLGPDGTVFSGPDFIWKIGSENPSLSNLILQCLSDPHSEVDIKKEEKLLLFIKITRYNDKYWDSRDRSVKLLSYIEADYDWSRDSLISEYGESFWCLLIKHLRQDIKFPASNKAEEKKLKQKNFSLSVKTVLWLFYSRWNRLLNPSVASVVFLGPDGVGKSSVIEGFLPLLNQLCLSPKCYHLRPKLLSTKGNLDNFGSAPHLNKPYGLFISLLKCFFLVLDYFILIFLDYYSRILGRCLVFDRYYYDLIVDPLRFRYGGPKKIPVFFQKVIWKPRLVILLKADAVAIHRRKSELSVNEINRQFLAYKELFKDTNVRLVVIHTDGKLEHSIDAAKLAFIKSLTL